ncbi:B-cell receptor CD22 [Halotydeus destructor]|nr:B-cell receptor CD22 [Halotydeus destructor]
MLTTTLTKIILAALTSQVPPLQEGQNGQHNTIDGYSEHVGIVGSKIALPCNTSIWGEELISLVLWYKETGEGGHPIYSIDARTSPLSKSKHLIPMEYKDRLYFDVTLKPPVLRIDPVLEEDHGDFRCRVDYRESRTKNFVTKLDVVVPPRELIIMDTEGQRLDGAVGPYDESSDLVVICEAERVKPLDVKIATPTTVYKAGQLIELQCLSSGSRPPAQISWFKDGAPLKPGSVSIRQTVSHDANSSLSSLVFIANIDDNGRDISCRADNPAFGQAFRPLEDGTSIVVRYAPQVKITLGPKIDRNAIREGMDVYLECIVSANPWLSEITWHFEDSTMFTDPSSGIIISNQSLVLQKVKRKHSGRYWCVAYNAEGQGQSDELYLKVQYAPVCKESQRTTYGIARNEMAQVGCDLDADPANVTFHWVLNNSDIQTDIRSFIVNGTRSIASYVPTSQGTYGRMACWGENGIGRQRDPCIFLILPASYPEPVTNCSVRNQTLNSILVTCEPGDSGGIRQVFFLEVFSAETDQLLANITSQDGPEFLVTELAAGSKLKLTLYSANTKGRSPSVHIAASTQAHPQRQTRKVFPTSNSEKESVVMPILGILIGVVTTLSLLSIVIFVCLKIRAGHESRPNQGEPSASEKQVCSLEAYEFPARPDCHLNCPLDSRHEPQSTLLSDTYYSGSYKDGHDVTYAELALTPCDAIMSRAKKSHQHIGLTEYSQVDFERAKFRVLVLDDGTVRRSSAADGCSETEVAVEAPIMDNMKPANYLPHDIIVS